MTSKRAHQRTPSRPADTPPRRAYSRPELTVYGPLAKLTRGTFTVGAESGPTGSNMKNSMCL